MTDIRSCDDSLSSEKKIANALKMLEDIEKDSVLDIAEYKARSRKLIEALIADMEENSDQLFALEHRVKYLEQECDSKDIQIEKITSAMQDAVDDCRVEAEEMVEEMVRKVSAEVDLRRDSEIIILRLQSENSRLKDTLRLQRLPGIDKCLEEVIQEVKERDAQAFEAEMADLKDALAYAQDDLCRLRLQRDAEMRATISVVSAAQQKIEFLHHQLKAHIQARVAEREDSLHSPAPKSAEKARQSRDMKDNGKAVVPYRKKAKNRSRKRPSRGGGEGAGSTQSTPQSAVPSEASTPQSTVPYSPDMAPKSLSAEMQEGGAGGAGKGSTKKSGGGRSSEASESSSQDGTVLREQSTSLWKNFKFSGN